MGKNCKKFKFKKQEGGRMEISKGEENWTFQI